MRKATDGQSATYTIRNLSTGEIQDGSSASGYPTNIGIFRALCPMRAPDAEFR